jgi:hypothetical protein
VLDGVGLEPSAGVPELVGDDAHAVEVGIVVVDLVLRVGPPVSNRHSFEDNARVSQEGVVIQDFISEGGDVVSGKRFARDVKGTFLEGRPLLVEVGEEVEEVVGRLSGRTHQRLGLILDIGEAHRQGLVDENSVAHDVPGLGKLVGSIFSHSDGSKLGECSELRTGAGSSLQPKDEGDSLIGYCDAVRMRSEEAVVHSGLSLGVVPVDFLIAFINNTLPE